MKKGKEKQVQIDESLFSDLCRYFLLNEVDKASDLAKKLNKKLDSIVDHNLYTLSKTAPTEAEKEKARIEYLNRRGIPEDFRW